MPNWKSININDNLIKASTERSVLIAMPHSSQWDGYCFWHPAKLVREGRNSASCSVSYHEGFTFRLKKYGKGRYNSREAIAESEINAADFEEAFGAVNANIQSKANPYETHKPEKLEPEETEALAELRD